VIWGTALGALRAYGQATGVTPPDWREERLRAAEQELPDAFGAERVQELVAARLARIPGREGGDLHLDDSGPWVTGADAGVVIERLLED
jgi:hypothetical protein